MTSTSTSYPCLTYAWNYVAPTQPNNLGFIGLVQHYKLDVEAVYPLATNSFLTTEQIQQLAGPVAVQLITTAKLKTKVAEMLDERRKALAATCLQVRTHRRFISLITYPDKCTVCVYTPMNV